jgi:hypothetical protein
MPRDEVRGVVGVWMDELILEVLRTMSNNDLTFRESSSCSLIALNATNKSAILVLFLASDGRECCCCCCCDGEMINWKEGDRTVGFSKNVAHIAQLLD